MDFGTRIRELRKLNNLTITELAKYVGTRREYFSDLERNVKQPSFDMLKKICQALNITLSDFFNEGTEPIALTPELKELLNNAKDLTPEQIKIFTELFKTLK